MRPPPTSDEDEHLLDLLTQHSCERCRNPECDHAIGWGDIAWNNRGTDAGTPYCAVEIICCVCGTDRARITSWYPSIDDHRDILYVLRTEEDWDQ